MKKTTEIKFTLNEREFNLVKKCVDYCAHRMLQHQGSGITKAIKKEDLKQLKGSIDTCLGERQIDINEDFYKPLDYKISLPKNFGKLKNTFFSKNFL